MLIYSCSAQLLSFEIEFVFMVCELKYMNMGPLNHHRVRYATDHNVPIGRHIVA